MLAFDNVSKWYGQVLGIMDVSTSLEKGVIGILGPNGAGKSTFLKLATGQLRPDKGKVTVFGESVWNNSNYTKHVGYCPEYENMYDWMTGYEFVNSMLLLSGFQREKAKELTRRAMKRVNMEKRGVRKIRTYSKGMRQRIKIAQAIAHRPKILFLDEPLAGTDPMGRIEIIKLIRELGKREMTVVVSSHILHEVEKMTERLIMLYKGRVIAWGNMEEIRDKLDEFPHTLEIRCSEINKLAKIAIDLPGVTSVKIKKNGINVLMTEPNKFYLELPKVLVKNNITIQGMGSLDEDLESIFSYLVRRNDRA